MFVNRVCWFREGKRSFLSKTVMTSTFYRQLLGSFVALQDLGPDDGRAYHKS